MIQLKANYDVTKLPVFLNSLTGPFFSNAMAKALNKAIVATQREAILVARETVQLRRQSISSRLRLWKARRGATLDDIDAQLSIAPTPISLASYPYQKTIIGYTLANRKPIYSVSVNVKSGFKTIRGAFEATGKSGVVGLFQRERQGAGFVSRTPIKYLRGPSLGDIFSDKGKVDRLQNVAQDELGRAITTAFAETVEFAADRAGEGF